MKPVIHAKVGYDKKAKTWWARRYLLSLAVGCKTKREALRHMRGGEGLFFKVATCVWCGCTDRRACKGGCHWVRLDKYTNRGICSACAESS